MVLPALVITFDMRGAEAKAAEKTPLWASNSKT
jgi:hypothetical protein